MDRDIKLLEKNRRATLRRLKDIRFMKEVFESHVNISGVMLTHIKDGNDIESETRKLNKYLRMAESMGDVIKYLEECLEMEAIEISELKEVSNV